MRRTLKAAILVAMLATVSQIRAAEVIDLRPGYWESTWTMPDDSTRVEHDCYTEEGIESMRFFMTSDENCSILPGSQSRTHIEADMICTEGPESMKIHALIKTSDSMNYDMAVTYDVEGQEISLNIRGRWLHDGCSYSDMPIS